MSKIPKYADALPNSPTKDAKQLRNGKKLIQLDDTEIESVSSQLSSTQEFQKEQRLNNLEQQNKQIFEMLAHMREDVQIMMSHWGNSHQRMG